MRMQLAGIVEESVVDGPGIRMVVFFQGCAHACPGCHNPETHDPQAGESADTAQILQRFAARPALSGLTLSGGEPLLQPAAAAELAQGVKRLGKHLLLYSGYTWEEILVLAGQNANIMALLQHTDLLIDGPFVEQQRNLGLAFRGSANQRLIDVQASLAAGQVQILERG